MSNKKVILGLSGVATSGKDTFATILINELTSLGKTVDRFAFATALKADCDMFCKEKLGISSFTQIPNEKTLIRPLLVWYGDAKRKQSNGRYWVDIIDKQVKESTADYCLITDVRYDFYPRDEITWVKDECNGIVVHVSRWSIPIMTKGIRGNKVFIQPANEHEAINDPKVKDRADCTIEWESVEGLTPEQLITAPSLVRHVHSFMNYYLDIN